MPNPGFLAKTCTVHVNISRINTVHVQRTVVSASAVSGLVLMRNFRFIFRTVYGCTAVLVCCFGTVYCTCLLFWDSVLCTCSLFWDSVLYLCVVLGQCTVPVCFLGQCTVPVCWFGTVDCAVLYLFVVWGQCTVPVRCFCL